MGQAWAVSMKDTGLLLSPRLDLCVLYTQWRLILSSLTIALRLYKDKETYQKKKMARFVLQGVDPPQNTALCQLSNFPAF